MRQIGQACAVAMTVALASCASNDRDDAQSAAPNAPVSWAASSESSAQPTVDWLADFNDPILTSLVMEALEENYDLAATLARVEQASAVAIAAGAPRLPTLDAGMSANYAQNVVDGSPPSNFETRTLGLSLSTTWEVDVWGRLRDQARAGRIDELAAIADLADARLSLSGLVAQSWYALVEARLLTALSEDEVLTRERVEQLTERRFRSGVTDALDVRLARSALATARSNLAASRNAQNNAARQLEVLLARYPAAEIEATDASPTLSALSGAGAPGELLARRPDLRAAEARLEAAGLRADQARKALLPSLTLSASGGTSSDTLGELFDPDYIISQAAGSLLAPIFRGGALRAEKRRTEAQVREQVATYAGAVLTAYKEVEDALDAEHSLAEQEAALAIAVDEAIAAEELAVRNYSRGVSDIFNVLDAQSSRINAESALISVARTRAANRVSLHLAVGGSFLVEDTEEDEGLERFE